MLSHALISSRHFPSHYAPSKTLRIKVNVSFLDAWMILRNKNREKENRLTRSGLNVTSVRKEGKIRAGNKNRQNTQQSLHSIPLKKSAVAIKSARGEKAEKHTLQISWCIS